MKDNMPGCVILLGFFAFWGVVIAAPAAGRVLAVLGIAVLVGLVGACVATYVIEQTGVSWPGRRR
jgi:hypothetical protein